MSTIENRLPGHKTQDYGDVVLVRNLFESVRL